MNALARFWAAVESLPGLRTSYAQWRQFLGDDLPSVQPLLMLVDRLAGAIPVPGCPYAWYRVVEFPPDKVFGVNDDTGEFVELSRQDVLSYQLDVRRLGKSLALALGFEASVETIDGVPHGYRLGMYRPLAGFEFPVLFTSQPEPVEFQRNVESLALRIEGPFVLLAPTAKRLRPVGDELLRKREVVFLPLAEAVALSARGGLVATDCAEHRLANFRRMVIPQSDAKPAVTFFPTPAGAAWSDLRLRFIDGETVSVSVGGLKATFIYSQMGLADGRNAKPTKQWELLKSFAEGRGLLTWNSASACRQNKKRKEYLATNLRDFFRLAGEPIELTEDKKGWRTAFAIEDER